MLPGAKRFNRMRFDDILGLALTAVALAYLGYAMLRPEKF